jgi:hypothetical protein
MSEAGVRELNENKVERKVERRVNGSPAIMNLEELTPQGKEVVVSLRQNEKACTDLLARKVVQRSMRAITSTCGNRSGLPILTLLEHN